MRCSFTTQVVVRLTAHCNKQQNNKQQNNKQNYDTKRKKRVYP